MCTPLCYLHREENVKAQRCQGDPCKPRIKLDRQNGQDQGHLNEGGHDAVQRVRNERLNTAHAALDVARHASGLAGQMETQAQGVQVLKGF